MPTETKNDDNDECQFAKVQDKACINDSKQSALHSQIHSDI